MSLFFVLISIFSFCAETHPFFHQPGEYDIVGRKSIRQVKTSTTTQIPIVEYSTVLSSLNTTDRLLNETGRSNTQSTVVHPVLTIIDIICFVYFATEYAIRLIFAPNKFRFLKRTMCIIDLLALVPDCVEFFVYGLASSELPSSFIRYIPVLRVMRMFRVFRLIRHIPGLWVLFYTLRASINELTLMVVFMLEGMLIFASLIYFTEQGETFTNIPVGFWWALITMTTVGYGDMFPTTPWGYLIGSICALCGLLMIAFTVPVIVSNFIMYYTHIKYAVAKKETDREKRVKQHIGKLTKLKRRLSFRSKGQESVDISEEKTILRSNLSEANEMDVTAIYVDESQAEVKNNVEFSGDN